MKTKRGSADNAYGVSIDTLVRLTHEWCKPIQRGECSTVCYFPFRSQQRRLSNVIERQKLLRAHIPYLNDYYFSVVNLYTFSSSKDRALASIVQKSLRRNNKALIFVMGADRLLSELEDLAPIFEQKWHEANGQVSFVYLFTPNITYPKYTQLIGKYSSLYQNICYFRLFSRIETKFFVNYLQNKFSISLPKTIVRKILSECGGRFWLVKQAVRIYMETGNIKSLFHNKDMVLRLEQILSELSKEEQECLIHHAIPSKPDISISEETQQNLIEVGYLTKSSRKIKVAIPILAKYLCDKYARPKLINTSNGWTLDGTPLQYVLSEKELRLFGLLLDNNGHLVNREDVARTIWNETEHPDYTDWSLDRFVSRLRKKIRLLGITSDWLRTIKGKGYISLMEMK